MSSAPIVAVGDADTVAVFSALGVRVVTVEAHEDAAALVREVTADPDVRIIFMTEPVYQRTVEIVEAYRGAPTPVVTLIPTVGRNERIAAEQLRTAVRIAIGSEIV